MYQTIMAPVDLAHADKLTHALDVTGDLAKHWGAKVVYVGVSAATPGSLAHTPEEYRQKLEDFAAGQAQSRGIETAAHAVITHDPAVDLDPALLKASEETGANLVVMASHIPNVADRIWPSNGGTIATRAAISVMVVRPD